MRPTTTAARLLLVLALVALGCGACGTSPGGSSGGAASCVGPYLDDQPPGGAFGAPAPTVAPGGTLTVHGHLYRDGCDDTGSGEPEVLIAPVRLTLTLPGDDEVDLGRHSPGGADAGFEVEVRVPAGTPAGQATVRDDRSEGAAYVFEVG